MRKKRVTGRFYVFLALLLAGCYFILRELLPDAASEALVQSANATYSYTVDAVVVRDETVAGYEGNARIVYAVDEGDVVPEQGEVCEVYPSGYSEKELQRLEIVRQSIRSYHEMILDNIVDGELDRLENKVQDLALQVKTLIRNKSGGSLLNLEKQLEKAMADRQEYLRQNQRQDYKLNDLYDQETKRLNALNSWQTIATSPRSGVVSFYLDGYEEYLNAETIETVTADQIKSVLAGRSLASGTASRLNTNIFRVVGTEKWYVVFLSGDVNWNPTAGQDFTFQIQGYADIAFVGRVISMQKSASEVMAVLEVSGSPGPLMNLRSGKANIAAYLSGMSVPVGALSEEGGQMGVWLQDAAGTTFTPVELLSKDSRNALVRPLVEGTLNVGQRVLIH